AVHHHWWVGGTRLFGRDAAIGHPAATCGHCPAAWLLHRIWRTGGPGEPDVRRHLQGVRGGHSVDVRIDGAAVPIVDVATGGPDFPAARSCRCARGDGPDGDQLRPFCTPWPVTAYGPGRQERHSAGRLHRYAAQER